MAFEQLIGKVIGKYRIESVLGQGGMGVVFKGTQLSLNRAVAIKMLPAQLAMDQEFLARFKQEAKIIAGLTHEHIVYVYDIEHFEGSYFIIMEFIDGVALNQNIKPNQPVPIEDVRNIGIAVCRALDAAHARGIIHRDIKASNIMITRDGKVKLMDFGIARVSGSGVKTRTGAAIGTPEYMSPEQARGEAVTAQSDLYSLGVLLYEMTTGTLPFVADDPFVVALKHVTEEPLPPRQHNPAIPPWLDQLILKTLSKDVKNRHKSAKELENDLLKGGGESAPVLQNTRIIPVVESFKTTDKKPSVITSVKTALSTLSSNQKRALLGACILVLIVIGGVALFKKLSTNTYITPQPTPTAVGITSNETNLGSSDRSNTGQLPGVTTINQPQPHEPTISLPKNVLHLVFSPTPAPATPEATQPPAAPQEIPPETVIPAVTAEVKPAPPTAAPPKPTSSPEEQAQRLFNSGKKEFDRGNYTKAEKLFTDALKVFPAHSAASEYLQKCRAKKQEIAEAEKKKAEEQNQIETKIETTVNAKLQMEEAWDKDDYEAVITYADAVLKTDPQDQDALEKREKATKRIAEFKESIKEETNNLLRDMSEALQDEETDDLFELCANDNPKLRSAYDQLFEEYKDIQVTLSNLSVTPDPKNIRFNVGIKITGIKKSDKSTAIIYENANWSGAVKKAGRSWKLADLPAFGY